MVGPKSASAAPPLTSSSTPNPTTSSYQSLWREEAGRRGDEMRRENREKRKQEREENRARSEHLLCSRSVTCIAPCEACIDPILDQETEAQKGDCPRSHN